MNSTRAVEQNLASGISDRAFRLYCVAVLRSSGEWTTIPELAAACNLTPHQARQGVVELHTANLLEKRCQYKTINGRREKSMLFRLRDENTCEASA
ncbi:hypothetical protein ABZ804_22295 [Streptomyces sp. NPDC047726]|uniref:hypothetical protein n=1 Tax=unclassified Streptomyces TaxID=2593676 RepID=UPI0033DA764A